MNDKKPFLSLLMLSLSLVSCNGGSEKHEKSFEEIAFGNSISTKKEFKFDNSYEDWKTINDVELITSYVSNKKVPHLNNSSLYCTFEIGKFESTISVNINPSANENAKFSVKLLVDEEDELKYKFLETCQGDIRSTNEKGVYYASSENDSIFNFDISSYNAQRAVVFVTAYSNSSVDSGILLNSISINNNDSIGSKKEYAIDDIVSDWSISGNVNKDESFINLGKNGTIKKDIKVDDKNPFLKINLSRRGTNEPNIQVKANGKALACVCTATDTVSPTNNETEEFVYNFLDYLDQVIKLEIVNSSDSSALLSKFEFIETMQGYDISTSWTHALINRLWTKTGNIVTHVQGICLHSYGSAVSISNIVPISSEHCYFNLRARVFIRDSEIQDETPALALFVNDSLIRAIGYDADRVSPSTGDVETFVYDLSAYISQKVTIKIENNRGPHACIDYLYLDGTAEVEPLDR